MKQADVSLAEHFYKIGTGDSVEVCLIKHLSIGELNLSAENIRSLIFHAGYLTIDESHPINRKRSIHFLKSPNAEIAIVFAVAIFSYFSIKKFR